MPPSQPRTYLVPKRERTNAPPPGWVKWMVSVSKTSSSEFVEKCGLDAYFFLRYLRTLLKIFVPAACIILPVLAPLNAIGGRGTSFANQEGGDALPVKGLDRLAWGNVRPDKTERYWVHWVLALMLIVYVCFVIFQEFRSYIRMRQAYLTSPQHRLRASATTVLVSSIPRKWCTAEALDGLYDVFPGGIRNIWLNRDFDALLDKVNRRDKLARKLETAETDLIKACVKAHEKKVTQENKKAGNQPTKAQKEQLAADKDRAGARNARGNGVSSGNPQASQDPAKETSGDSSSDDQSVQEENTRLQPPTSFPTGRQGLGVFAQGRSNPGKGFLGGKCDGPDVAEQPQSRHHAHNRGATDQEQAGSTSDNSQSPHSRADTDGEWERSGYGGGGNDNERGPLDQSRNRTTDAFDPASETDGQDAEWRKYVKEKDRETMRLPIFGWEWMFPIPLIGKKVDKIYYCRKEVARLNAEIEQDQANPEQFPLLNSAFIQFHHQAAAHMACQCISHHWPKQMAPRLVEIDPYDVIWDNMSIPWWQIYIRTAGVVTLVAAMVVLWVVPVAFTSAISQISKLVNLFQFLAFLNTLPQWLRSAIQGLLPPALLALLLFVLPFILRQLAKLQGNQSGTMVELSVQRYYFFFLFVQLFLVVSVAAAVPTILGLFKQGADAFASIPEILALNVPNAANYFFAYMLLQALSVSAGALVQLGQLLQWFILGPVLDSTARSKFRRQVKLPEVKWGKFFPMYTNLACIGLIYSVISPLILIFNVITFSLFWFVYRYNSLYVTKFTRDTGGLLYPTALNYTFIGVYVMEIVLIGLFFLVRDADDNAAGYGQGVGMVVILILTVIYQILLNEAFGPLFRYLPITLEDDAVARDEEFARMLQRKQGLPEELQDDDDDQETPSGSQKYDEQDFAKGDADPGPHEMQQSEAKRRTAYGDNLNIDTLQNSEIRKQFDRRSRASRFFHKTDQARLSAMDQLTVPTTPGTGSWADRSRARRPSAFGQSGQPTSPAMSQANDDSPPHHKLQQPFHANKFNLPSKQQRPPKQQPGREQEKEAPPPQIAVDASHNLSSILTSSKDIEAQRRKRDQVAAALFSGSDGDLEDLTPEQRDMLVQRAFKHSAMRARRPVVWIPRDELGVSDDEIRHINRFSEKIWVSNVRQGLDAKARCVYSGAPPDFLETDLIRL